MKDVQKKKNFCMRLVFGLYKSFYHIAQNFGSAKQQQFGELSNVSQIFPLQSQFMTVNDNLT